MPKTKAQKRIEAIERNARYAHARMMRMAGQIMQNTKIHGRPVQPADDLGAAVALAKDTKDTEASSLVMTLNKPRNVSPLPAEYRFDFVEPRSIKDFAEEPNIKGVQIKQATKE